MLAQPHPFVQTLIKTLCLGLMSGGLAACGGGAAPLDAPGIIFEKIHLDLGERMRGGQYEVVFPFEVEGAAVTINDFELSCGCVDVQLIDSNGEVLPLQEPIPAGTRGELRALWKTEGYQGERISRIRLLGEGPGVPQLLRFEAELQSWFQVLPSLVEFEAAEREEEQSMEVVISGPEPFRLLDIAASFPGITVAELPQEAASSHRVTLIREAGVAEEGTRTGFVQIRTDREGLIASVPVRYTVASTVFVQPGKKWILGEVRSGIYQAPELTLGARQGSLEVLDLVWEGVDGAELKLVTLEPVKRFRVELILPADLASGPVRGTIHVRLAHRDQGQETIVEREIPVYGLVTTT